MTNPSDGKNKSLENVSQPKVRKSYKKPQLTEFGHIEKLTEGSTGTKGDGGAKRR